MDRLERGKEQRFLYVTQFNLELLDVTISEWCVESYSNHEVILSMI